MRPHWICFSQRPGSRVEETKGALELILNSAEALPYQESRLGVEEHRQDLLHLLSLTRNEKSRNSNSLGSQLQKLDL